MGYFPFFIELNNVPCLIIGGGAVARRKAEVLQSFGGKVTMVARSVEQPMNDNIVVLEQEVCELNFQQILSDNQVIILATDNQHLNHQLAILAKQHNCHVNSATSKEDSTFLFPAVMEKAGMSIAISSEGKSPAATRVVKQRILDAIPEELEGILEQLEELRPVLKQRIKQQEQRKQVYYSLLQLGLKTGAILTPDVIEKELQQYENNN